MSAENVLTKTAKWLGILFAIFLVAVMLLAAFNWGMAKEIFRQRHMIGAPHFDTERPVLPEMTSHKTKILSFSKTNGFRHYEGIESSKIMLQKIAYKNDWFLIASENNNVFDWKILSQFDLVVLNNSSGNVYTAEQRKSLRRYLNNGGGLVAMHAAGGDPSYDWQWYVRDLIKAQFVDHPMDQHIQTADLKVVDTKHFIMEGVPSTWQRTDEWYNFAVAPTGKAHILLEIDESTYDPEDSPMGSDHPMMWSHSVGEGRVFYSAIGHTPESYQEPMYQNLIDRAMHWALNADELSIQ